MLFPTNPIDTPVAQQEDCLLTWQSRSIYSQYFPLSSPLYSCVDTDFTSSIKYLPAYPCCFPLSAVPTKVFNFTQNLVISSCSSMLILLSRLVFHQHTFTCTVMMGAYNQCMFWPVKAHDMPFVNYFGFHLYFPN
jgi:hypothetical protein